MKTTKICPECGEEKPLIPESWHKRSDGCSGFKTPCKVCRNKEHRKAYHSNSEEIAERRRVVRQTDRKKYDTYLRSLEKYGLEEQDLRDLMDDQMGCCAVCGKSLHWNGLSGFHIDHDHNTGDIRGILCARCNQGLGYFDDNPDAMLMGINYLKRSN